MNTTAMMPQQTAERENEHGDGGGGGTLVAV
jgi:hypothetical protein